MKHIKKLFLYRKKLVAPYVDFTLRMSSIASYVMSALFFVALIFRYGFLLSPKDLYLINNIFEIIKWVFIVNSLLRVTFDFNATRKSYSWIAWLMLFLLLLIPAFSFIDHHKMLGWIKWLFILIQSNIYMVTVLSIMSIMQLSKGLVMLLGRRLNPSFIFSASFLAIILIGAGLLMLPRSTYGDLSFIDALFTSTSATCVTGLVTIDVATNFTPMGIFFIMLLIQIGGIGVMTLTSFFAIFYMGNASFYKQTMICDLVSSKSLNSLLSTLLYILGFTLAIEALGAFFIFIDIHNTLDMSLHDELLFSVFHSISAFCNAGFSTLSMNLGDKMLMCNHNAFYLTISFLIILGGIGFPILVNLFETMRYYCKCICRYIIRGGNTKKRVHLNDINTKIVLAMTFMLIIVGTLFIAIFEWNGAMTGLSFVDKCVQSFFTAVCPRTAGFTSLNIMDFKVQSILFIILLMIIGGGTQSTAGGVKVNVFAVILLNLRAILIGEDKVTTYNRELSADSVHRSNSTLVLYIMFICVSFFLLTIFEPDKSLLALLFESVSALSTVGLSMGITPLLGDDSKVVIIFLMFIGRVGVLTMMTSIVGQHRVTKYKYPSGNIIIN